MQPFQQLEVEIGKWANVENVVACSSGSAALHLALESMQLPPGSEVLIPDFTMIACARAVTLAGLVPVFVDCNNGLLMDPYLVQEAFDTETGIRPVATMAVHIYGRRCDMDAIEEWTKVVNDAVVIEDMAELHGVNQHHQTDAAAWSFYANKCVAGSEGGVVAFRDPAHAALARSLRSLGFTDAHDFAHNPRGHNYRMSNVHAELIRQSLARVETNLALRRQIEGLYDAHCPDEWKMPKRDVVWVYDLKIPGLTRERQSVIVRSLNAAGIAARHSFLPMSCQEEYRSCRTVGRGNALRLSNQVFYLPVQPGVTTEKTAREAFEIIRRAQ